MSVKNITKKCKACEINFDRLQKQKNSKTTDFHLPKDIPVSQEMKRNIEAIRKATK